MSEVWWLWNSAHPQNYAYFSNIIVLDYGLDMIHLTYVYAELISWLILGLRSANERRRYYVTTSLIGWVQT